MELEVIENKKNSLEFKITGERHTFPQLLKHHLLKDSKVEFAACKLRHPQDSDCIVLVKTKGKDPKKALEDAAKAIAGEASDFEKSLKKAK